MDPQKGAALQMTREDLTRLYDKVKSLAPLGANGVHRRTLSLIREELQRAEGVEIVRSCRDPDIGPGRPRDPFVELDFADALWESRNDDRRRAVFADPAEAIASQFVDFYTDRIDVLELRSGVTGLASDLLERGQTLAIDAMGTSGRTISVSHVGLTVDELVSSLRSLAEYLEQGSTLFVAKSEGPEVAILQRESCRRIGTEAGPTRWTNNGTTLQQRVRDVMECRDYDQCCGNDVWTKHGDWRWVDIWQDAGNPLKPPPASLPDFVPHPWNNKCSVFPSPVAGRVTSDWGWRNINGHNTFHQGMDIGVPVGTPVTAVVGGEIVHIRSGGANAENGVIIRTGREIRQYWHIDPAAGLTVGQTVAAAAALGAVAVHRGGSHLHFARYRPPEADWTQKNPGNSMSPCP